MSQIRITQNVMVSTPCNSLHWQWYFIWPFIWNAIPIYFYLFAPNQMTHAWAVSLSSVKKTASRWCFDSVQQIGRYYEEGREGWSNGITLFVNFPSFYSDYILFGMSLLYEEGMRIWWHCLWLWPMTWSRANGIGKWIYAYLYTRKKNACLNFRRTINICWWNGNGWRNDAATLIGFW